MARMSSTHMMPSALHPVQHLRHSLQNEHEVQQGVNRRRVVTINEAASRVGGHLGGLYALLRRTLHGGVPGRLFLRDRRV